MELRGRGNVLEGQAATQRDPYRLEKWDSRGLVGFNKDTCKALHGERNPWALGCLAGEQICWKEHMGF